MKREYKLFLKDIVKACEYIQEFVDHSGTIGTKIMILAATSLMSAIL